MRSADGRRLVPLVLLLGLEAALVAVLAFSPPARAPGMGHGEGQGEEQSEEQSEEALRRLVLELQLTDLALFSAAGYCRHPTQADRFSPHADHPAAIEHFPAGSIVPPPRGPGEP